MVAPLLLASGLAEIGSMGLNALAQDKINAARNSAIQQELQRQGRWDSQIAGLQDKNLQAYGGVPASMPGRATNVADYYKATGGDLPSSGPTAGAMPAIVNPALANESKVTMGKVNAFNNQQGGALANLRSFGDMMGGAARTNAINNGVIAGINSMKAGSSSILGQELQSANNAGNGLKSFADILGGLGKVGMAAGLATPDEVSNIIPGTGGWFGKGPPITYAEGLRDGLIPV
jgi:hypothetical protein